MMIDFLCNPFPPVSLEWGDAPLPEVGHFLTWKMPGGFKPGRYRVLTVEWVLTGSIQLRITINPA